MKEEQFFFNGTNYSIKIGRNKTENDHLVKTSAKTDIWFHVNGLQSTFGAPRVFTKRVNMPSSHVVLLNNDKLNKIPKQVIKRCACLCKSNSSCKSEIKCEIIYTEMANVLPTEHECQVTVNGLSKIIVI
jgi:predicted ribosome quality control (RQC) complex YloA/Tae2 family protein